MRRTLAIATVALIPAAAAADDKAPVPGHNGLTVGTDGKLWRVEGCAAYPVEPQAGAQSKPVAALPVADATPAKLAKSGKPDE